MPRPIAQRICEKVGLYASEPVALARNVETLKASDGLIRLRVADWRVIMKEDAHLIDILEVMPRGKNYKP